MAEKWARGLEAEECALKFFENRGWRCLNRRLRTPYAEVDLVVDSPKESFLWAIDVKAIRTLDYLPVAVKSKQKDRLKNAIEYLAAQCGAEVRSCLVVVRVDNQVEIFEDWLS